MIWVYGFIALSVSYGYVEKMNYLEKTITKTTSDDVIALAFTKYKWGVYNLLSRQAYNKGLPRM